MNEDDVQAKVDMMSKVFMGRLHVRYEKMNETFARCLAAKEQEENWVELHRLLHSLAGAAGTFGCDAIGEQARRIELRIVDMLAERKWHAHDVTTVGQELLALQRTN